jgi:hypothetical protein
MTDASYASAHCTTCFLLLVACARQARMRISFPLICVVCVTQLCLGNCEPCLLNMSSWPVLVLTASLLRALAQEHVVVLVHSKFSGKKTIFLDGKSEFREQKVRAVAVCDLVHVRLVCTLARCSCAERYWSVSVPLSNWTPLSFGHH